MRGGSCAAEGQVGLRAGVCLGVVGGWIWTSTLPLCNPARQALLASQRRERGKWHSDGVTKTSCQEYVGATVQTCKGPASERAERSAVNARENSFRIKVVSDTSLRCKNILQAQSRNNCALSLSCRELLQYFKNVCSPGAPYVVWLDICAARIEWLLVRVSCIKLVFNLREVARLMIAWLVGVGVLMRILTSR